MQIEAITRALDMAYWKVTYGYDEPDLLRCSHELQRILYYANRLMPLPGKELRYNNAVVKADPTLKNEEFVLENSRHPEGTENWERFRTEGKVDL